MNFKTPKNSSSIVIWTFFIYFTAPIFEWLSLKNDLESGVFPASADSMGIPFGTFIIVWFFSLPLVIGFVMWVSQKYPRKVSMFGYNPKRPFWSFFWSVTFGFLAFDSLISTFSNLRENYLIGAFQSLLLIYLFLLLRASIVFRLKENI